MPTAGTRDGDGSGDACQVGVYQIRWNQRVVDESHSTAPPSDGGYTGHQDSVTTQRYFGTATVTSGAIGLTVVSSSVHAAVTDETSGSWSNDPDFCTNSLPGDNASGTSNFGSALDNADQHSNEVLRPSYFHLDITRDSDGVAHMPYPVGMPFSGLDNRTWADTSYSRSTFTHFDGSTTALTDEPGHFDVSPTRYWDPGVQPPAGTLGDLVGNAAGTSFTLHARPAVIDLGPGDYFAITRTYTTDATVTVTHTAPAGG